MAKRFSDLGIKPKDSGKIFNCQQVSITDILNSEIEVIDFQANLHTQHGEGRYLVHFRMTDGSLEGKFFTASHSLISCLDQMKPEDLPVITVIKAIKCGKGKIYQFT
ncbi:MAG: hypothetical protein HUK04_00460 [Bacteroidaceae bacterium]|nr:hypothetical protein [Bacteroidaceae bacterium]